MKSEMGGSSTLKQTISPPTQVAKIIPFPVTPLFKNRDLLHQKYIVERLSADEIAADIFSSRSTVLKYLRHFEIPVRPTGSNVRRRNLAYGIRRVKRKEVLYQKEQEIIKKMERQGTYLLVVISDHVSPYKSLKLHRR